MRYDSYESKIVKLANFFKLVFRHRIKIIIATAIMMATTVTLLATKGIISDAKCPEEVIYGDTFEYYPDAFISDAYPEYSSNGEDWTTEYPLYPGSYYVRATAGATFGERHSAIHSFRILPKNVTVAI